MSCAISICIPTFNYGRYIKDAIASALRQTKAACEILVSDDWSTDGTEEVVSGLKEKIRYIRTPVRLGISGNYRFAVENAIGTHVVLLSADDALHPRFVEKTEPYCRNYGIVAAGGFKADETLERVAEYEYHFVQYIGIRELHPPKAFLHNLGGTCYLMSGTVWRREDLLRLPVLPREADLMPEWYYGIVLSQDVPMRFLWEPLFLYRKHRKNASDASKVSAYLQGTRAMFRFLLEKELIREEWREMVLLREERAREDTLRAEAALGLDVREPATGLDRRESTEKGGKMRWRQAGRGRCREAVKQGAVGAMRWAFGERVRMEIQAAIGAAGGRELRSGMAES